VCHSRRDPVRQSGMIENLYRGTGTDSMIRAAPDLAAPF
jgi:hypothetical protein